MSILSFAQYRPGLDICTWFAQMFIEQLSCYRNEIALSTYPGVKVSLITMHSLRRGAAQAAEEAGSSIDHIMKRGAWASKSGLKPYLLK